MRKVSLEAERRDMSFHPRPRWGISVSQAGFVWIEKLRLSRVARRGRDSGRKSGFLGASPRVALRCSFEQRSLTQGLLTAVSSRLVAGGSGRAG